MASQGISEPIAGVSTSHDRASESERFERIEEARRRQPREQPRRRPPAPPRPRDQVAAEPDDRTIGTRLDVMA